MEKKLRRINLYRNMETEGQQPINGAWQSDEGEWSPINNLCVKVQSDSDGEQRSSSSILWRPCTHGGPAPQREEKRSHRSHVDESEGWRRWTALTSSILD
ncbi:unnamed protein product [Cuscuta epithymum]|uniref:Uncharacterized protein n=1 Tax=Cuscuta epithymum TaxID=186058 RepID=A0AAV0C5R2_9ASTE|nr:unnamed protein product [Cuscuta epithymum]